MPTMSAHIDGGRAPPADVCWLPNDSGIIVTSHGDGALRVWDASRLAVAECTRLPGEPIVHCHGMTPHPASLASSSVALGCEAGLSLVDLRTASSLQGSAAIGPVTALSWDPLNEYQLWGGGRHGALTAWDVRRLPSGGSRCPPHLEAIGSFRCGQPHSVSQVSFFGASHLVVGRSDGHVALLSMVAPYEVIWQVEMDFETLDGFRLALVDEPALAAPAVLVPMGNEVGAYDCASGMLLWRQSISTIIADALVYNADQSVCAASPCEHACGHLSQAAGSADAIAIA